MRIPSLNKFHVYSAVVLSVLIISWSFLRVIDTIYPCLFAAKVLCCLFSYNRFCLNEGQRILPYLTTTDVELQRVE